MPRVPGLNHISLLLGSSDVSDTVNVVGAAPSFGGKHDSLVFLALDHLQSVQEMLLARFNRGRILRISRQVRVDQLDQTIEVLRGDLLTVKLVAHSASDASEEPNSAIDCHAGTYRFILLVEIVHVTIEDLDEQLDRGGGLHARIGDAKSPLETF